MNSWWLLRSIEQSLESRLRASRASGGRVSKGTLFPKNEQRAKSTTPEDVTLATTLFDDHNCISRRDGSRRLSLSRCHPRALSIGANEGGPEDKLDARRAIWR